MKVSEAVKIAKNSTTFPVILNDVGDNTVRGQFGRFNFFIT